MRFRLDLLIVDPEPESRNRLKQAAMALPVVSSCRVAFSATEGVRMLSDVNPVDVVFFSQSMPEGAKFVAEARQTNRGKCCAFIIVKRVKEDVGIAAAESVLEGTDGFIGEPFSVEELTKVTDLAMKMKLAELSMREEAAMRVILEDSMVQIDRIAMNKTRGEETVSGLRRLTTLCSKLTQFSTFSLEKYLNLAKGTFVGSRPFAEGLETQAYGGVSKRVQKILDKKAGRAAS